MKDCYKFCYNCIFWTVSNKKQPSKLVPEKYGYCKKDKILTPEKTFCEKWKEKNE